MRVGTLSPGPDGGTGRSGPTMLLPAKRSLREAVVKEELVIVVAFGQPHSAVWLGAPGLESSGYIGRVVRSSVAKQDKSMIGHLYPTVSDTLFGTPDGWGMRFPVRT